MQHNLIRTNLQPMTLNETISAIDGVYGRSLLEPANDKDKRFVLAFQLQLVAKCDSWLKSSELSSEKRCNFNKLRRLAEKSLAEQEKGYDILMHWPLQRELLSRVAKKENSY